MKKLVSIGLLAFFLAVLITPVHAIDPDGTEAFFLEQGVYVDTSGNLYLDDGSGASPIFYLKDGTDETAAMTKVDAGYMTITTVVGDGVNILTGNLKIGDGTPTLTLGGEDLYVEGTLEADGAVNFAGTITMAGSLTLAGTAGSDLTLGNSTGNFAVTSDNADFTLTDATDDVFQLVNSGGAILLDIDLGASDLITLGDGAVAFALDSDTLDISSAGAVSGATGVSTSGALASTGTFDVDGAANISDTTAGADVAMGNSTGNITLLSDNFDLGLTDATDDVFKLTIAGGNDIMDVDLGAADTITIGDAAVAFVIVSSGLDLDSSGNLTNVGSITATGTMANTGDFSYTGHKDSQIMLFNTFRATQVDWTPTKNGMELGANKAAKTMWCDLSGLKVGDEIVSYRIVGDMHEEGGDTNTLDCKIFSVTPGAPTTVVDITGGGIAQVTTDGNIDVEKTLDAVETIAADKQYGFEITGTTTTVSGNEKIVIIGIEVDINRK